MRWCVFVVFALFHVLPYVCGMNPYGATGRQSNIGGSSMGVQTGATPGSSGSSSAHGFPASGGPGSAGTFSLPGLVAVGTSNSETGSVQGLAGSVSTGSSSFGSSGSTGIVGSIRPADNAAAAGFVGSGDPVLTVSPTLVGRQGDGGSTLFTRVVQEHVTPTVTQTSTYDVFTTLTDIVFNSYGVTLTQFILETATRPINQVVMTPVDDRVAISTTIVQSPEYVTVTETKSDFRLVVRTSVNHVTLTHTSYVITHVPYTMTATETVQITSQIVRTVIRTQREVVTDYRTLVNTVFVHGGYF